MNISQRGIDLIKSFEGCKLQAYKDAVGVTTIGYGSTEGVTMGDTITQDEAENLLKEDVRRFEDCVNAYVDVPITQNQFDALVCFAFNVGCNALKNSTLLRLLNGGEEIGVVAPQFLRWDKAGGKPLAGLTRRRQAESVLFSEFA
jgi:lysozyme